MRFLLCKIFQRRIYDLFSSKQSLLLCFASFCMTLIAILHIFGIYLIWNQKTDHSISCFNKHLYSTCNTFPIDVVYTWVNGTDPKLIRELYETSEQIQNSLRKEFEENLLENDCQKVVDETTCETIDDQTCFETAIVFIVPQITDPNKLFQNVTKFEMVDTRGTLIYFSTIEQARETALKCFVTYNSTTYLIRKTLLTVGQQQNNVNKISENKDKNHKISETLVKLSSNTSVFICTSNTQNANRTDIELLRYLSPFARKQLNLINIYGDKQCALFAIKNLSLNTTKLKQSIRMALEKRQHLTTDNQSIVIQNPIELLVNGIDYKLGDLKADRLQDLSDSRFADNQELRYSLRSLERNANWIRNVFIVTNGQIPNWLNLDNQRIKIITHEEIFANKSHLPSFSSPAIETHLHRIPGLSKKFLYLNDDILFGRPVYPEDFYTESKGFKVYLSWPVPNCADGCPMNWLKDGYCDQACNSTECLWDGGDCDSDKINLNQRPGYQSRNSYFNSYSDTPVKHTDNYCSQNCVDSWLSDKFCDQVCNNIECAYDLGDCGTDNYKLIYGIEFHPKQHIYYYRSDSNAIYFDFKKFFISNVKNKINFDINEISYENNSCVRSSAFNMNHKILVFLFYANQEKQDLNITVKGLKNKSEFLIEFQALVNNDLKFNTSYVSIDESLGFESEENKVEEQELYRRENNLTETDFNSDKTVGKLSDSDSNQTNRYQELLYPKILAQNQLEFNTSVECVFNIEQLPDELRMKFNDLDIRYRNKLLTDKGLKNFRQKLKQLYAKQICNFENNIKTFDTTISAFDWERQSTFSSLEKSIANEEDPELRRDDNRVIGRHLMDSYADSLKHVNHIYNKVFGIEMRKVPAHMAHFIDIDIMTRLEQTFKNHFDITSSHKIRSSDDMQFAFAYNYYLMSELKIFNTTEMFDDFDVDSSGTWNINEIRTVIINIYELPLKLENYQEFYELLFSCCLETLDEFCTEQNINANITQHFYRGTQTQEQLYYEIPKSLIIECQNVTNKLSKLYINQKQNKFEILGEDEVSFKMIRSNATIVGQELDQINKHLKKFMCLNDNIDHKSTGNLDVIRVKRMLVQFYESIFPIRSEFELPDDRYNRFQYIHEYKHWLSQQNKDFKYNSQQLWIVLILFLLILIFISKKLDLRSEFRRISTKISKQQNKNHRNI